MIAISAMNRSRSSTTLTTSRNFCQRERGGSVPASAGTSCKVEDMILKTSLAHGHEGPAA